jgi:hypothetical protein
MIDQATSTGWIKIVEDIQPNQKHPSRICDYNWLVRFPLPQFIVFNNSNVGKFKRGYKRMYDNYGLKAKSK